MKRLLTAGIATILLFAGVAYSAGMSGAEIAQLRWNASNIGVLRALNSDAIARLINYVAFKGLEAAGSDDIREFTWVDLAGDGRYELVESEMCCLCLYIYWQEAPGKISEQRYKIGKTRDLDGDGKLELLLWGQLDSDSPIAGGSTSERVPGWDQVYRLRNGRYVEASRDFPEYYNAEVLPRLEKDISKARQEILAQEGKPKPKPGPCLIQRENDWLNPQRRLAALLIERDKILRVLGRDPVAGLAEAREWMKSSDRELVEDAVIVLKDIGGHEQELRAAKLALKSASDNLSDNSAGETCYEHKSQSKIANLTWNAANVETLRAAGKAAVAELLNDNDAGDTTNEDVGDFTWVDLEGNGKVELVVSMATRCCCSTTIYWQEAPGKLWEQTYDGCATVKDLDGDGKQELILSMLDRYPSNGTPVAELTFVYRLKNGRYVEASRDFPKYYDTEVLPQLEKDISEAGQEVAEQQGEARPTAGPGESQREIDIEWFLPERHLAAPVMEKDRVLRMLGRDPNAGLAKAREWMKSSDPLLLEDAVEIFEAVGGHEQELRAAKAALFRLEPWHAMEDRKEECEAGK